MPSRLPTARSRTRSWTRSSDGERSRATRRTRSSRRSGASRSWSRGSIRSKAKKAATPQGHEAPAKPARGAVEEPGDLHPAVLRHDRRRPAAGAVPRDPRQAGTGQELRRGHPEDARGRRGGRVAGRRDEAAPKAFDTLFTNMVAAGEAGGILDTILKRLATYIEKNVKLKGQVKSAMIYPVAVIVIAGMVVGVILWKVIPTFAEPVRRPRRRAAAADPRRHRAQQRPGRPTAVHRRRHRRPRLRLPPLLRHRPAAGA